MNTNHIRGLMREKRLTIRKTAKLLELSVQGFYNKLDGPSEFTISEAQRLSEILNVPITEILEERRDYAQRET